jgi:capsular polysaccharide transport system permease protein
MNKTQKKILILLLPTIIAAFYYFLVASDVYVSQSKFSVYDNKEAAKFENIPIVTNNNIEDLLLVKEYAESKEMLDKLENGIKISEIFRNKSADIISKLKQNPNQEEFLEYFRSMIEISIYQDAKLITLKAKAFSAEDSKKINEAMTEFSEEFINSLLSNVEMDKVKRAEQMLKKAEDEMVSVQNKLANFRNKSNVYDPKFELENKFELVKGLVSKKVEIAVKKQELEGVYDNNFYKKNLLNKQTDEINKQLEELTKSMVSYDSMEGKILKKFETLKFSEEFAKRRYEVALTNLEETYKGLETQDKYVVRIENPILPDYADEPARFFQIFKIFFISVAIIGIFSLVYSGIKEHLML